MKDIKEKKEFGRIIKVGYGFGGYQDVEFGASFTLGTDALQVRDFWGVFSNEVPEDANWTDADQTKIFADTIRRIISIMRKARVQEIHDLINTPIELIYDGNMLKRWRILTEVIK